MESQGLDGFSLESLLCHTPKWYFSRSEIDDDSPSRKDSINLKTESQLRASYCSFLQDLGKRLNAPQATIATAMMLCHRFYMYQSHARNGWQTIATVSMFLACKAEETPRFLRDVIMVAYGMLHRSDPAAAQRINHKDVYQRQKELILTGERLLLTTVAFDLNIQHPYKPLVGALKKLKISDNHLVKVAWNFVNDWLRTTLCLQYKPHYIAAGSMYLAARFLKVKLPSEGGKVWWMEFDISPLRLDEVIQAEMRMLRWMCGKTRKDRIRNVKIQRQVGVAPIDIKIREGRLRWFGHLQRRPTNAPTRKLDSIETVEI